VIPLPVRYLLKGLVLPPGGLILIGVAGLLTARRRPRLGFALCAVSILALWALATPFVADAIARAAERYPAFDPEHLTPAQSRAQAIVILGGGIRSHAPEYGGDAPSLPTLQRLIEGAKVARVTGLPILVSASPREAAAMRRFLEEDLHTPVRWIEAASGDTHENAVFSARILAAAAVRRIILVTSSTHMARSMAEFAATGLEPSAAPAEMLTHDTDGFRDFVPSVASLSRVYAVFYEWGGEVVRGGVSAGGHDPRASGLSSSAAPVR
jgi:uncharacterized SAM-binding protein YcdF (DUF218 family)